MFMIYYGDKTKINAAETLKKMGFFIPFLAAETFHGRGAREGEKDWRVDPYYDKGTAASSIAALSTGSMDIANTFATINSPKDNPQIHEIDTIDPHAVLINYEFDYTKLAGADAKVFQDALHALRVTNIAAGSPPAFEDRYVYRPTYDEIKTLDVGTSGFLELPAVERLCETESLDKGLSVDIAGALNAQELLQKAPYVATELFAQDRNFFKGDMVESVPNYSMNHPFNTGNCLFNTKTVAHWLEQNHVVGKSYELNQGLRNNLLFDLSRVDTKKRVGAKQAQVSKNFSGLGEIFRGLVGNGELQKDLQTNLSRDPRSMVEWARKVEGFGETFDADAGNWEGFTLGQHTETVLRVFEHTYEGRVPEYFQPFMNLMLLVHDIGKGESVKAGNKRAQTQYNEKFAQDFMTRLNLDERLKSIIVGLIGKGSDFATDAFIRKGENSVDQLRGYCENLLKTNLQGTQFQITDNEVQGLMKICEVVQTCDSAAYTDMARTYYARKDLTYKNAPSYNASFKQPKGLTKQNVSLK
jgi:hypothetical protein